MKGDVFDSGGRLVSVIRFTPDGRWLVGGGGKFGGPPACVLVWDVASRKLRHQRETKKDMVCALEILPDGKSAAWSSWFDDEVRVWTLPGLKSLKTLPLIPPDSPALGGDDPDATTVAGALAASPDGKWLAAGCWDLRVKLWELRRGSVRELEPRQKHNVDFVAFIDKGQTLISGAANVLAWWSVRTGKQLAKQELRGQAECWHALSPDRSRLISVGNKGGLWLWDLADRSSEKFKIPVKKKVQDMAFSPAGDEVAISPDGGRQILFWNVAERQVRRKLNLKRGTKSLAYSPDGEFIACTESTPFPAEHDLVRLHPVG